MASTSHWERLVSTSQSTQKEKIRLGACTILRFWALSTSMDVNQYTESGHLFCTQSTTCTGLKYGCFYSKYTEKLTHAHANGYQATFLSMRPGYEATSALNNSRSLTNFWAKCLNGLAKQLMVCQLMQWWQLKLQMVRHNAQAYCFSLFCALYMYGNCIT